ncbi:unnamed protein product [Fraxinus pennsylvanica]|uniref:Uncharacterized protein n=1 Tax=Fraxinus pennsylvanica TaxID=56036 RepID=A0AAD1ZP20_9LAMI|nr:unnamed protein product [Fraxinus pennsylvanica]
MLKSIKNCKEVRYHIQKGGFLGLEWRIGQAVASVIGSDCSETSFSNCNHQVAPSRQEYHISGNPGRNTTTGDDSLPISAISWLATSSVSLPSLEGTEEDRKDVIPLLCSIFLANQGAGEATGEGKCLSWDDDDSLLEAYAALLLAFLSTERLVHHRRLILSQT